MIMPMPANTTMIGYTSAEVNLARTCANFSKWSAMRRSTSTSAPLCSPAFTMLTYKSENTRGCWAIAVGQPLSFRHVLLELAAHVRRNALGFQIRHAVERGGQRHPGLEQVGKLLRERGQLLQLRLAPLLQPFAQRFRQKARQIHFLSRAARGGRGGLAGVHGDGEQAEPLDLQRRRRAGRRSPGRPRPFRRSVCGPCRKIAALRLISKTVDD